MIHHFFTKQFIVFGCVGGVAAFLHWSARILISQWLSFSVAVILAYVVGMAVAFVLNTLYVFPTSQKERAKQARDFFLVNMAFFPVVWLASISLEYLFENMGMMFYPEAFAHAIAVVIPTFATFLIYKFFAFKDV